MQVFESLWESAQKNELILVEGGLCQFHLRKDGQLTIYDILSIKPGAGTRILNLLKETPGASSLFAKCPRWYPANAWYQKKGFQLSRQETSRSGAPLNVWVLPLGGGAAVVASGEANP